MDQEENKPSPDINQPAPEDSVETSKTDLGPVDTQDVTPVPAAATQPKKPKNKKKIIVIGLVVVLLLGGAALGYWLTHKSKKSVGNSEPAKTTTKVEPTEASVSAALEKFIHPTTGETWLASPKKIAQQGYSKEPEDESTTYYEVGKHGDKTIIASVYQALGDNVSLFEKSPDGSVVFVSRPDTQAVYNTDNEKYYVDQYKSSIKIDTDIHYDSLSMPASLDIDKGYKVTKPTYPGLGDLIRDTGAENKPTIATVKTYGVSKLIRSETTYADTKLTSVGYAIDTPIGTRIWLGFEPVPTSLKGYQWSTGNSADGDKLKAIARGCGGLTASITRSDVLQDSDLQAVGKTSDSQDVYELKDPNNALLVKAYQEFVDYAGTDSSVPYAGISKTDFIKEHGLVVVKDKFGQKLVYTREQLSPGYGCAKPVVYLYPTKTQSVNVKVGADVKLSDPFYPAKTGWQNVIAQPNGQLSYNGKTYGSLFWEGPGYGAYPAVTSGTVVKREDAIATIRVQLAQQGLNATEIADFVGYWQDKLPTKPYVRLTWFNTAQLNELAPLSITPKPDTLIRVFLDFSGLDAPIDLPAQHLSAIPRSGFTVVEWGGLSPFRLY